MAANKVTYTTKVEGTDPVTGYFSVQDANELKTVTDNHADLLDGLETNKAATNHNHSGVYQPVMGADENYVTDTQKDLLSFITTANVDYNTEIPLNKALTVMAGKTLASNDIFTILAAPVNEAACIVVLIGNGTNVPVFTNFDEITGEYDATLNVKNIILFYRLESVNYVNISQTTAV